MRSAQHFNAIHVEEGATGPTGAADVDAIDVECDDRIADFGVVGTANAAYEDLHRIAIVADRQRGHLAPQRSSVGDTGVAQRVAGQRCHGDRYVLDALAALLRGDDHLFELRTVVGGGGGLRGGLSPR